LSITICRTCGRHPAVPEWLVCALCADRQQHADEAAHRAELVASYDAGRKLAIAAGRRPPKQPKVGPPKRPKFFRTQREEDDWNHLHGAPAPKLCRFANRS
jgi:hypothetical protein